MIHTLRYGLISALQASSLYIGKILVQGSVNTLGTPGIAAYTAATRIEGFANSFGDSGGNAVSVMVSQNLGAGNHDRVKKSLFWGLMLNWTVCVVISLFMFFWFRSCTPAVFEFFRRAGSLLRKQLYKTDLCFLYILLYRKCLHGIL